MDEISSNIGPEICLALWRISQNSFEVLGLSHSETNECKVRTLEPLEGASSL